MKEDRLYPMFVSYLEDRLNEGKISAGAMALSRMSREAFEGFKRRFEKSDLFEGKQIESFRDKKIDDIFDDLD
jgi:hypothetical protein